MDCFWCTDDVGRTAFSLEYCRQVAYLTSEFSQVACVKILNLNAITLLHFPYRVTEVIIHVRALKVMFVFNPFADELPPAPFTAELVTIQLDKSHG